MPSLGKSRIPASVASALLVVFACVAADPTGAQSPPQFVATELLGRPTDRSITLNVIPGSPIDAFVEYGTQPGVYPSRTRTSSFAAGSSAEIVVDGLTPDTHYYYRLRYAPPAESQFAARPEHSFHTQRSPGSTFTFTVQSDSHIYDKKGDHALYTIALQNQLGDAPDFMVDLGDTFGDDHDLSISAAEVDQLHLDQRPFMGSLGHSAAVFLALGNHEGEGGYYLDVTPPDNLAVYGTLARQKYFPNPVPDGFYSGNTHSEPFVGLPENYYAWQWGDALFVVIDAYRGSVTDPKVTHDLWDWSLGEAQYMWLVDTLERSDARYKFVFAHHLLGQTRGAVGWAGKFEWGGLSKNGDDDFATKRPGWAKPIHRLFVDTGVTIFFQGHDHLYAREELDGVVYQETPMPSDATYRVGDENASYYGGTVLTNSGHLRVTVAPTGVKVDYVRAFLPGDGVNGQVAHSYTIETATPVDTLAVTLARQRQNGKLKILATSTDENAVLAVEAYPADGAQQPIDLGQMTKPDPNGNEFRLVRTGLPPIASVKITSSGGGTITAAVQQP